MSLISLVITLIVVGVLLWDMDTLLYWLCAAFLLLPSQAIVPVIGALAVGLFAAGFWTGKAL